jgi:hypothetical protein
VSKIGAFTPYAGFPASGSLLTALRPYPQFATSGLFGATPTITNSPTGNSWYDALQVKVNKRLSHGLQATSTFTWSKALVATRENIFDPTSSTKTLQGTDQPFLVNANIVYTVPRFFNSNRMLSAAVRDWQAGAFLQYGSGFPLTPPSITTTNNVSQGTQYQLRVPGQPLFLKDLNCGCINPTQDQLLNPAAWTNPVNGGFGLNALYGDFRSARRPQENFNIGRNFRIKERVNFQIRAEFTNIFNRTTLGNPSTTNPAGPLTRNGANQLTAGFGVINEVLNPRAQPSVPSNGNFATNLGQIPRQGTIIARFQF